MYVDMASSLVCCFCGFHGSSLTINLTKDGVTAGFLLPFELGVVLVVVDLVVILWLVYDTSSRERRKKKLYSIALVLARLVGLPSFGLELWPLCFSDACCGGRPGRGVSPGSNRSQACDVDVDCCKAVWFVHVLQVFLLLRNNGSNSGAPAQGHDADGVVSSPRRTGRRLATLRSLQGRRC